MGHDHTTKAIVSADTWAKRISQIRMIPQRHGTQEHGAIYAEIARKLYVQHLAPDFAYIHPSTFYETEHFFEAYDATISLSSVKNSRTPDFIGWI